MRIEKYGVEVGEDRESIIPLEDDIEEARRVAIERDGILIVYVFELCGIECVADYREGDE